MKSGLEDIVFNIAFESLGRLLIPVTLLLFAFHTRSQYKPRTKSQDIGCSFSPSLPYDAGKVVNKATSDYD